MPDDRGREGFEAGERGTNPEAETVDWRDFLDTEPGIEHLGFRVDETTGGGTVYLKTTDGEWFKAPIGTAGEWDVFWDVVDQIDIPTIEEWYH